MIHDSLIKRLQAEVEKSDHFLELIRPLHDTEISITWREQVAAHDEYVAMIGDAIAALSGVGALENMRLEYEAEMQTHIRMLQTRIADSERERAAARAAKPAP